MANQKETKITVEAGKQELFIEREFDAPRELVFRAHTDPELYVQWVGPRGLTNKIEVFDMEDGGSWRFVSADKDGNEYTFHGINHEILPPERMISTFEYEPLPERGHVSLEIAEFEELPEGRTKLKAQSVYRSVADRDGMVESGMEQGVKEGYERLDELLEKLKSS